MTLPIPSPDHCQTMAEVRAGVDALDAELIALLARRFGYMRAAARIKQSRDAVRDEARKAQVITNARAMADLQGVPPQMIEDIWELLVEGSIAYELDAWDDQRA